MNRLLVLPFLVMVFSNAYASLADFVEIDDEMKEELNSALGTSADAIWTHVDTFSEDSAPIIMLEILSAEEDGADMIGSYSGLMQSMRGKSDIYKILIMQRAISTQYEDNIRLGSYEVLDDVSAFIVVLDFLGEDGDTFQHMQLMQWSDNESRKCVITSEIEHRVSDYYSDSISNALVELVQICSVGLNNELEPDT